MSDDRRSVLYELLGKHIVETFKSGRKQLNGKGDEVVMPPGPTDCKVALEYMKLDPERFSLKQADAIAQAMMNMARSKGGDIPPVDTEEDDQATDR